MANYDWIIDVIEDLERFAVNEDLCNLRLQLKQTRNAVDLDLQSLSANEGCDVSKRVVLAESPRSFTLLKSV